MVELLSHCLNRMFHDISDSIEDVKDQLSELDGVVGDGDHGVTMSIGFQAVKAELSRRNVNAMAPDELMNAAASAFLNSVGASTGPLYATGLRRAAQALAGATEATAATQAAILKGLADGVRERGKGQRGDKTMLDALIPAAEAAANACRNSESVETMWGEIIAAAEAGAASTRSMIASKGRAARLGERALGHLDPGAVSAVVILRAMARTFCGDDGKQTKTGSGQTSGASKSPGRRFKVAGGRDTADEPPASLSA
jgi:phosphoenolpyruvate---glycerone phosphotransferase subunit DhaL